MVLLGDESGIFFLASERVTERLAKSNLSLTFTTGNRKWSFCFTRRGACSLEEHEAVYVSTKRFSSV